MGVAVGTVLLTEHLVAPAVQARRPAGLPDDIIQLNSNENPYGPFEKALEAMTRSQTVAARYPDALEEEVREAIAQLHGVEPEQVILGCGSGEVLRMADMAFLGPGKKVVVAEPTFEAVLSYARVTRAEPIKVPLTADYRHDLTAMAAVCNDCTGLLYVCNPNNPTGTIVTGDELEVFLGKVPASVTVLVDEAYHHFAEDRRYASAFAWVGKQPNLVVVRTFSKIYGMAGMRLGYAVSTMENIRAMRAHMVWNNGNAAVLEAALASLQDSEHLAAMRKRMNDTRRWLCRELEKDGRSYIPSEANFVMVDVGGDVAPVIEGFRERRLLVGRKFPSMGNWLRVSIGTEKEMETFMAHLREIVPALAARASS
jgi:histidinol-phosphate aminotransferase